MFVTVPIQHVVNWPVNVVQVVFSNFVSRQTLLKENARFRSELLFARAMVQRLHSLEQENYQLRTLLNLTKQLKLKFLAAQLLTLITDSLNQQATLDKGKADGVYVGQPVIDNYGLFGQIVMVDLKMSKVLLVTDSKSAVPTTIVRNGLQTIVIGTGHSDGLELINIPETADVRVGDLLVTSNLGQRFPVGYAVGVVKTIKKVIGERFLKILIAPSARVNNSQYVLLLWPKFVEQIKK